MQNDGQIHFTEELYITKSSSDTCFDEGYHAFLSSILFLYVCLITSKSLKCDSSVLFN